MGGDCSVAERLSRFQGGLKPRKITLYNYAVVSRNCNTKTQTSEIEILVIFFSVCLTMRQAVRLILFCTVHCDIIIQYEPTKYTFTIKPTRCTNFSHLFWNKTLHVSDISSVHHQEFFTVHTAIYTDSNIWRSGDRASWWILIIKPTRCTNFSNLFWNKTLHVSDISSVHHQEFITVHTAIGICHTGLLSNKE